MDLRTRVAWVMHKTRSWEIMREAVYLDATAAKILKQQMARQKGHEYVLVPPRT